MFRPYKAGHFLCLAAPHIHRFVPPNSSSLLLLIGVVPPATTAATFTGIKNFMYTFCASHTGRGIADVFTKCRVNSVVQPFLLLKLALLPMDALQERQALRHQLRFPLLLSILRRERKQGPMEGRREFPGARCIRGEERKGRCEGGRGMEGAREDEEGKEDGRRRQGHRGGVNEIGSTETKTRTRAGTWKWDWVRTCP